MQRIHLVVEMSEGNLRVFALVHTETKAMLCDVKSQLVRDYLQDDATCQNFYLRAEALQLAIDASEQLKKAW